MNITKGLRRLSWDFWKSFPGDPLIHVALAWAVIVIFFADIAYIILTPKVVRDERNRQ
jgi:hypothetical protein